MRTVHTLHYQKENFVLNNETSMFRSFETFMNYFFLCVSEDFLSELLCIYTVGMGTFDLHGLILCVSEGLLSK